MHRTTRKWGKNGIPGRLSYDKEWFWLWENQRKNIESWRGFLWVDTHETSMCDRIHEKPRWYQESQKAFYFVGDRGYFALKSVFGLDHDTDKYREFIQNLEDKCGLIATEEVNPKGIWEDSTPEGYEYCVIKHEFVFDKSKVKEELFEKEKEYHESESELLTRYGICLNPDQ